MASDATKHSVTTDRFAGRVIVKAAGQTIADSQAAIVMHETGYAPVYYLPQSDVRMELLEPTGHTTRCPHKGTARYWSIKASDRTIDNAVWGYDGPFAAVAYIQGLVAFYPDRIDAIEATGL